MQILLCLLHANYSELQYNHGSLTNESLNFFLENSMIS